MQASCQDWQYPIQAPTTDSQECGPGVHSRSSCVHFVCQPPSLSTEETSKRQSLSTTTVFIRALNLPDADVDDDEDYDEGFEDEDYDCLLCLTNSHFSDQDLVVQTLDSAIHWINQYPADKY